MSRDVPELVRLYLQQEQERGRLVSAKLARALKLSPAAVDHYLSGKNRVPMKRLDAIARFLDFPNVESFVARARELFDSDAKHKDDAKQKRGRARLT